MDALAALAGGAFSFYFAHLPANCDTHALDVAIAIQNIEIAKQGVRQDLVGYAKDLPPT